MHSLLINIQNDFLKNKKFLFFKNLIKDSNSKDIDLIPNQSININSSLTSVIGKNASGKTSFLKRLVFPHRNDKVIFDEINLADCSIKQRSLIISWMPHTEFASFNYKVKDFVLLGRYPHSRGIISKKDLKIVEEYLEKLSILDLSSRDIQSISKGEYQKVCIARTLVSCTPLLILDEPFSNLDISSIKSTLDLLQQESKVLDRMIISSFHDINVAVAFSKNSFISLKDLRPSFFNEIDTSILEKIYDVKSKMYNGFFSLF